MSYPPEWTTEQLRFVPDGLRDPHHHQIQVHGVAYYYKAGMSVEEILAEWDYLNPAQVFGALAYYHDNREQIDTLRQKNSYEPVSL